MIKTILIISSLPIYNMKGNIGIKVLNKTINGFLKDGWNVKLIYPTRNESESNLSYFNKKINEQTFNAGLYYKIASKRYFSFLAKLFFWVYFYYKVKIIYTKYFKNECFDVIYCIGPLSNFTASKIISSNKRCIRVARYLGVASTYERYLKRYLKILTLPDILGYKTKTDVTIITDDGTKGEEFIKQLQPDIKDIYFLRNGIDKNLFNSLDSNTYILNKYQLNKDTKILLTVGRLSKLKRIDRSINLIPTIIKSYENVCLVIVGNGELYNELVFLSAKNKCENKIIFSDAVPHEELIHYYNSADIYLSFYDTSNAGNPLFEAMTTGNCIVTINTGDTKKFLPDGTGFVMDKNNMTEVANKIIELLKNDEHREKIGENARIYAQINIPDWDKRIKYEIDIISDKLRSINISN